MFFFGSFKLKKGGNFTGFWVILG